MREQVFFTNLVNLDRQPNTSENTWLIAAVRTQMLLSSYLNTGSIEYLTGTSQKLGLEGDILKLQHYLIKWRDITQKEYPEIYDMVFDDKTREMEAIKIV